MSLLKQALYFAARAHEGQVRKYNKLNLDPVPYILHPISVAARANEYGLPLEVQAAALLHDVLEDTMTTIEDLLQAFPTYVTQLVVELTNPSHKQEHKNKSRAERKAIDREHLRNASSHAKLLKLIDRIDNLEDMEEAPPKFKKLYIEESRALLSVLTDNNPSIFHVMQRLIERFCLAINELESTIDRTTSNN